MQHQQALLAGALSTSLLLASAQVALGQQHDRKDYTSQRAAPNSSPAIADSDTDGQRNAATKGSQVLSEQGITHAVEDELHHDSVVSLDDVDVRTAKGVVTLTGTVTNLLAKERAEHIAETVRGVRDVDNQIAVRSRTSIDAQDLEAKITQALLFHPATEAFEVKVQADPDGEVLLSGDVSSGAEKTLVGRVAKGVSGVTGVRNDIEVNYASMRPDNEVAAEIRSMLRQDAYIDGASIDVNVDNGVVTLSGSVGSAAEKSRAAAVAWTAGTKRVDTQALQVDPSMLDTERKDAAVANLSDEQILDAVRNVLRTDPTVAPNKLDVSVNAGIVTLRGSVESLKDKRVAKNHAQSVTGVQAVRDRLRVRDDGKALDDEEIERRVVSALAINPITEAYEISVDVREGRVDLTGHVDSWFERGTADDLAANVRGVREVDNHLQVAERAASIVFDPYVDTWSIYDYGWYDPAPATVWRQDSAIAQEIKDELWWSPFVDEAKVTVSVQNGVATLSGTVDNWSERRAASENAFEGGATGVVNELNVES